MKFSTLNLDFSSVSNDPSDSRKLAHAGFKEGYPAKSGYFNAIGWSSVKTVADMHKRAACHNKHWQ